MVTVGLKKLQGGPEKGRGKMRAQGGGEKNIIFFPVSRLNFPPDFFHCKIFCVSYFPPKTLTIMKKILSAVPKAFRFSAETASKSNSGI